VVPLVYYLPQEPLAELPEQEHLLHPHLLMLEEHWALVPVLCLPLLRSSSCPCSLCTYRTLLF
jgi:hypothetical protein